MRLAGIANSTALLIDGDMHQMLMDKYPLKDGIDSVGDDMYYQLIHQKLMINEKANMLKTPIYTIVYDSTMQTNLILDMYTRVFPLNCSNNIIRGAPFLRIRMNLGIGCQPSHLSRINWEKL